MSSATSLPVNSADFLSSRIVAYWYIRVREISSGFSGSLRWTASAGKEQHAGRDRGGAD
jgi:hypothetical protein